MVKMKTSGSQTENLPALLKTPINVKIPTELVDQSITFPPFLAIPNALNLRAIASPTLIPNFLFRSGSLSHLPPTSLQALSEDYGIKTIFDLRSQAEVEKRPNPDILGVENIWTQSGPDFGSRVNAEEEQHGTIEDQGSELGNPSPRKRLAPSEFVANNGVDGYLKMYSDVLENTHRDVYRIVFERLRDGGEGGILFHCTAGKDRTGILAALILSLVKTPREIIAHDYALTRIGIEPFREYLIGALLQQMGKSDIEEAFEEPGMLELSGIRAENILAMLEWMGEKWGDGEYSGTEGYLTKVLGFSKGDVKKIKILLSRE